MELHATGFNAWNQLIFDRSLLVDEPDDLFTFTKVLSAKHICRPVAHLSYTSVQCDDTQRLAGVSHACAAAVDPRKMYIRAESANGAVLVSQEASLNAPPPPLVRYPSLDAFWRNREETAWPCKSPVKQIAAYNAGFVVLYQDGTVATTGDARFEDCLGRSVDESSPAEEPCEVRDLSDLGEPIRKVSAGSYTVAALTEGGSLYVWGAGSTGPHGRQQIFPEISGIPNYIEVDGEQDVLDMAVGEAHAIALTSDSSVFVIGSNANGQLALARDINGVETWTRVNLHIPRGWKIVGVEAGPRSSFIMASQGQRQKPNQDQFHC